MLRRLILAGALLAPALVTACDDDSTGPQGATSEASVHAYVDVDGSGTISAGDLFIPGATITLEDTNNGQTQTAQTNQFGVALFPSLRAGSYRVSMSGGTVPAGAVLATASTPTLVAPFRGDSVAQEFRFVLNPGSISGVLFRDNNGNGVFDPGTDTPAPGMDVRLFRGTDTTAAPVAEVTTGSAGQFSFETLRPGSYTMVVTAIPTISLVGGNVQQVTVAAGAPTATPILFTGNLLSPIAEVRKAAPDQTVAFEGVATVSLGIFSTSTTGNQFNVQDATGGVLVLDVPLSAGIQQGDSVRVIGRAVVSAGEFVVRNPTITKLGRGTVPAPRLVTPAQVAASSATDPLQGSLIFVPNVQVTAVSGSATSSSYNVTVQGTDGSTFAIRVGSAAVGIPQTFWQIGRSYDITGLLASFNGPQVKVRSAADVDLRSAGIPIGELRTRAFADSAAMRFDTVTVEGVVHTAQGTFRNDNAYIQDQTGGILLFNVPAGAALQVGDSVRVTAAIDWFNGELELVRFSSTSPPVIEKLGTGALPQPRTISGAQMLSRDFEGQLVRLANATVDSVGNPSSSGGLTVWLITQDGSRVQVRVENNSIGLPASSWTVGSVVNVVGALSSFRGTPQLKPRSAADVTPGTAGVTSISAARAEAVGDTVSVEGVVTVAQGTFRTDNIYIQDPSGGIQVFGVPAEMDLEIGELVRVTGLMGAFNEERQIVRFSSTAPLVITRLGNAAVPAPVTLTGAQALGIAFEGQLARVENVEVVSVGSVSASSGAYSVTVRAPDGTTFTVRIESRAVGIESTFWVVGGRYDVTGVMGNFRGAGQLKPRSPADVVRR